MVTLSAGEGRSQKRAFDEGLDSQVEVTGQKGREASTCTEGRAKPCVEESSSLYMVWLMHRSGSGKLWPLGQILPVACFCMYVIYIP